MYTIIPIADRHFRNNNKWHKCHNQPCPNREAKDYTPSSNLIFAERVSQDNYNLIAGLTSAAATPVASTSNQPLPAQSASPAAPPPPPPEPTPQPEQISLPFSEQSELPSSSPPPPDEDPPDSDPEVDSDDDDDMSKALKAFDKVTVLKADESNWDTWKA